MNTNLDLWYKAEKKIQEALHLTHDALRDTDAEELTPAELQHLQNVYSLLVSTLWYLGQTRQNIIENSDPVIA